MRQLLAEGWMHNRVRMIIASFLVKDLHIGWPAGARHFLATSSTATCVQQPHGWQWTAGTGTDAAPYFRVFNPVTQGEQVRPRRRLRPPLGSRAGRCWRPGDPRAVAARRGLPDGYPERIVDHAEERTESLANYQALRARS